MTLTWLRWGPKMQQHRKVLQSPFTKSRVAQYMKMQLKQTHQLVNGIMKSPSDWDLEVRRLALAIVANIGYGVDVSTNNHQWVKLSDDAGEATSHAGTPGSSLVDRFPFGGFQLFVHFILGI